MTGCWIGNSTLRKACERHCIVLRRLYIGHEDSKQGLCTGCVWYYKTHLNLWNNSLGDSLTLRSPSKIVTEGVEVGIRVDNCIWHTNNSTNGPTIESNPTMERKTCTGWCCVFQTKCMAIHKASKWIKDHGIKKAMSISLLIVK